LPSTHDSTFTQRSASTIEVYPARTIHAIVINAIRVAEGRMSHCLGHRKGIFRDYKYLFTYVIYSRALGRVHGGHCYRGLAINNVGRILCMPSSLRYSVTGDGGKPWQIDGKPVRAIRSRYDTRCGFRGPRKTANVYEQDIVCPTI